MLYILYVNNGSSFRSVLPTYYATQQTVSIDTLHNNAPHKNGLREKTTACVSLFSLFSIESGVPVSRTMVETTPIQSSQTPTTYDAMMWFELKIVTNISFSERLAIANVQYLYIT